MIDDEPDLRLLVRLALERNGLGVRIHGNGRKAVAELRERRVDLVVIDLFMPEFDGLEVDPGDPRVLRSLADRRNLGRQRLLAPDLLPIARDVGADAVLAKPLPLDALLREVCRLLPGSDASPRRA